MAKPINNGPSAKTPVAFFGDLAMTTLFGGFDPAFYESYGYHFPFLVNYREQWEICNLYPLLIHLNLFGKIPGKGALPKDGPFPESIDVGGTSAELRSLLHLVRNLRFARLGQASVTPFSYAGSILNTIQRF